MPIAAQELPGQQNRSTRRIHRAWWVAAVSFIALVGAAAFRAVNILLYGLFSPFASALQERYGIRRVVSIALALIAAGSGLTVFMTASWQLIMAWGFIVGIGSGSMAMAFVATITNRWFIERRGLVSGVLTAGSAAGQLVFLPLVGLLVEGPGWRSASILVSLTALAMVPLVLLVVRDRPEDVGLRPYGAGSDYATPAPPRSGATRRTLGSLFSASRSRAFWLLAGTFAICGASTNGLVGAHFVPAAHDHGMPITAAASLLAVIGIVDLVGTIASGWLTDRFDPRRLLGVYYFLRGVSLLALPSLFAEGVEPPMLFFIVFYGLDWVATVPPTIALCREHFGEDGAVVFGWVLASHQIGAAIVASAAGLVRDVSGEYDLAWFAAGALCVIAAGMSLAIRLPRRASVRADGSVEDSP